MSGSIEEQEDKRFLLECIELYRSLPALWKKKRDDFSDINKKKEAYDILLRKYQEKYPLATNDDVKKKFNTLCRKFRKEMKKVSKSKESGSGIEEVYEPKLWYFDEMLFLQDQETQSTFPNTIENFVEEKYVPVSINPSSSQQQPVQRLQK
ncbi:uncharacterized protein LOC121859419, partial [Homarus americanus]|uniref:uncharacterized protein LOC121859419 n=1 Tax=Homarus americanus TaxID=6706 RepID=UPI001C44AFBA